MSNDETREALRIASRNDLAVFGVRALRILLPGDYQHFEYIDLLLLWIGARMLLGRAWQGVVNMPPRHLKTLCVICAIAWYLGRNATKRVMLVTHSLSLSNTIALKILSLVRSPFFQTIFPEFRLRDDKQAAMDFETTLGGGLIAGSFGSRLTGHGADLLVMDDPIAAQEAFSIVSRDAVELFYETTLKTRRNNPQTGARLLITHRTHPDDLSGKLLREGFDPLVLAFEAQEDERHEVGNFVFIRKKGEVLQPTIYTPEIVANLKRETPAHVFATQYQNRPVAIDGGLLKPGDFPLVSSVPQGGQTIISWDVASSTNPKSSYSVALVFVRHQNVNYLRHILRKRVDYAELASTAKTLNDLYRPTHHLVESASLGPALMAELQGLGANVIAMSPTASKLERLLAVMNQVNSQQVHLWQAMPGLEAFLDEAFSFPHGSNDDQIDALTQYLKWIAETTPAPGHELVALGIGRPPHQRDRYHSIKRMVRN
ncbi:hypothetical protein EOA32_01410 [Mesorhizobium sp. M1A.F.Ca.ET.072.01.1.1]|uniref:hypothetical protein n=1 Tax=Mesorhizobium sp. M1A.F.Ca.ET.072.01.1.1 TaxID=2496753 RepID=UPI000FD41E57|nr:hypothetical protein [Mesorhizobium sp. M1A.F.Ca.ET.072.01.1.1]RUW55437.1 hypothetical protein EOA32_01410 [Mesorhizobium sp. M1A.F.Ca.ET.072.01.1.1]TIV03746.1 MAG: hypothetical protein E5W04_06860 [Mesorhizobium sp.]